MMHVLAEPGTRTPADYDRWLKKAMPVEVTFNLSTSSDQWLRAQIEGLRVPVVRFQRVIVQGMDEATRVVAALARLKHQRGVPYGGSSMTRASR